MRASGPQSLTNWSQISRSDLPCPIHWRIERPASERVRDLSTRVLTIPTDWRYTDADMERVASILREV